MSVELFALGCLALKAWLDEQLATGRLPASPRPLPTVTPISAATHVTSEMPAASPYVALRSHTDPCIAAIIAQTWDFAPLAGRHGLCCGTLVQIL